MFGGNVEVIPGSHPAEIPVSSIHFKSNEQRMRGSLCLPDSRNGNFSPAVIFLHGMNGTERKYVPMAGKLAENGIAGMTVNLRGHGASEGRMDVLTPYDGLADIIASIDYLTAHSRDFRIDTKRIGICGNSYGSMLAALASSRLPSSQSIKSLLLRAPAAYTVPMMRKTYDRLGQEPDLFHNISDVNECPSVEEMTVFEGNVLVMASEKDEIIPASIPQAYYSHSEFASKRILEEIKGAPHYLTDEDAPIFSDRALEWFAETL